MFIRPYLYSLRLKDEIERQVNEMLSQGIIQPSANAFSSPVLLLVKKKDGSYHFCVDLGHLNVLIAKSKFPVLVFGQLMDDSWFFNLDLCARFYQILLHPSKEHKTTFMYTLVSMSFELWHSA